MSKDNSFTSLLRVNDDITRVVLPVACNKALVGLDGMPMPTIPEINLGVAELSRNFFLAGRKTNKELEYQNHIGTNSELFSATEIRSD